MRIIRKYANRRLYDTVDRKVVTLKELASLMRKEEDVRVIDHRTGKDITEETIAKILLDETKRSRKVSLIHLMRRIASVRGKGFMDFLKESWRDGMGIISLFDRKVVEFLKKLKERGRLSEKEEKEIIQVLRGQSSKELEREKEILTKFFEELLIELRSPKKEEMESLRREIELLKKELKEIKSSLSNKS